MGTRHGASALSERDASNWVQAHAALSRLAQQRAALDAEEGRWLLCAWRSGAHVHLGYGSFAQYVERLFGYKVSDSRNPPSSAHRPVRADGVGVTLPGW
jgi:hypothetical protein